MRGRCQLGTDGSAGGRLELMLTELILHRAHASLDRQVQSAWSVGCVAVSGNPRGSGEQEVAWRCLGQSCLEAVHLYVAGWVHTHDEDVIDVDVVTQCVGHGSMGEDHS